MRNGLFIFVISFVFAMGCRNDSDTDSSAVKHDTGFAHGHGPSGMTLTVDQVKQAAQIYKSKMAQPSTANANANANAPAAIDGFVTFLQQSAQSGVKSPATYGAGEAYPTDGYPSDGYYGDGYYGQY